MGGAFLSPGAAHEGGWVRCSSTSRGAAQECGCLASVELENKPLLLQPLSTVDLVHILPRTAASLVWASSSAGVKGQSCPLLPAARSTGRRTRGPEASLEMPTPESGALLLVAQPLALAVRVLKNEPLANPTRTQPVGPQGLAAVGRSGLSKWGTVYGPWATHFLSLDKLGCVQGTMVLTESSCPGAVPTEAPS